MDEPTEGLAPVIVEQVEQMLLDIGEQGDIGVLVVEQNIGVATAVAEKVAIMINGRINRIMEAARLEADRELQQRLLGVGQHGVEAEEQAEAAAAAAAGAAENGRRPAEPRGPIRVYMSNPADADALVAAGPGRPRSKPPRAPAPSRRSRPRSPRPRRSICGRSIAAARRR